VILNFDFYGTAEQADEYFTNRLHSESWFKATVLNRQKALIGATRIIDTLNYKGKKATVYTVCLAAETSGIDATDQEIRDAEAAQYNEFPRGADTVAPDAIVLSNYEIAFSLVDGKDPEMELEALGISSQGLESVRTTYARSQVPIEHIINGVPNMMAWRMLRPFLRDDQALEMIRV
jgi:hypothetical protein